MTQVWGERSASSPQPDTSILSAYTTRIREEALAGVLADINREAEKHARHLREGTSVGGESPLWHEAAESSMQAAAGIVRVAMSEIPEGQNDNE